MVYLKNVLFDYDPLKSASNKAKHGIDDAYWTAVITRRGERIRIISVRRSRREEKAAYEKNA